MNNKVGELIKAGLIDRYSLADAVVGYNDMPIKLIAGVRRAEPLRTCLSGLTRNEYAVLYATANNAD